MGSIHAIVFDCQNPDKLAVFWCAILEGYRPRRADSQAIERLKSFGFNPQTDAVAFADGPGPIIRFQNIEGQRFDNNRVHFEIEVTDRSHKINGRNLW